MIWNEIGQWGCILILVYQFTRYLKVVNRIDHSLDMTNSTLEQMISSEKTDDK